MEALPACKYGAACYRKNREHLQQFSHPSPPSQEVQAPSIADSSASSPTPNLVVVVLVGVPGSGKSRFCHSVIENASQTWTRICQDIVANGKRGTRAQCIKQATIAFGSSSSVFIDRTNLNREQRIDFIEFAKKHNAEAHAVVLNLPAGICITRAMNRTSHEGGLEGKKVAAVIQRLAHGVELPDLAEGFSRITVCRTDDDVDESIATYRSLSSESKLPSGVYDTKSSSSPKGSLEQFLDKPGKKETEKKSEIKNKSETEKKSDKSETEKKSEIKNKSETEKKFDKSETEKKSEIKNKSKKPEIASSSGESCATLAFPSISTADFRFDHAKAAPIIVETASEFLSRDENRGLSLVMIDIDKNSDILSRVRALAESAGLDKQRFAVIHGDITQLKSIGGISCSVIANTANWRLKGGGGGVNLAIYKAAGDGFEQATKNCAETLEPGTAVAVPLPDSSPLRTNEGVTHVVHVLGPNMNPMRPNCLGDDYDQGCKLLRQSYSALFSTFAAIARGGGAPKNNRSFSAAAAASSGSSSGGKPRNAFAVLMQASKRKPGNDDSPSAKKGKTETGIVAEAKTEEAGGGGAAGAASGAATEAVESKAAAVKKPVNWPAWAQALHDVAFHPEKHTSVILEVTDDVVVLPDLYAKAKKHLLVVSRKAGLDSIADLTKEHLPLLREMHAIAERWAKKLAEEDNSLVFRLGYHSVPSMRQLHLHVVSQDFDSSGLKNKKHWNSFTSSFFRDSMDVIAELESRGALEHCTDEMEKRLLDAELRCHRCRCVQPNIPRLKSHIASCPKPLPIQSLISA